jgi:hypothetical protein
VPFIRRAITTLPANVSPAVKLSIPKALAMAASEPAADEPAIQQAIPAAESS